MVETNARILVPGKDIAVTVCYARVQGTMNTSKLREKVCYRLRKEHGLIAVPCQDRQEQLLVATDQPLPERQMIVDEWKVSVSDTGEVARLTLESAEGWQLLPELIERMVTNAIELCGNWWTSDSLRHWYQKKPFVARDGIDALRRYAVSALPIEGIGIAVTVDVETAFFTQFTVADFFDSHVSLPEQRERQARFQRLTQRQAGHRGTLLYNNGETSLKCYLERVPSGKTCGMTVPRRVRGKSYVSLIDYYRQVCPELSLRGDDPVAVVSFPGLDHPQPVAAQCLKVRVMNALLPPSLIHADKIAPGERRDMIIEFWKQLGKAAFPQIRSVCEVNSGEVVSPERPSTKSIENPLLCDSALPPESSTAFLPGFWRPDATRVRRIAFPTLHFGNGQALAPPPQMNKEAYKQHFTRRAEMLERGMCYHFPPLMGRTLVCAYPDDRGVCMASEEMMDDLCKRMQQITGNPFEFHMDSYESVEDALVKVNQENYAHVVVVNLNDEPAAYTEAALGLPDWKIKRVTENMLRRQYQSLRTNTVRAQGRKSWDSFLRMTTLDLLQEMDGVPFRLDKAGKFEAQLVIDVSYDRRYYAQSLLIAREREKRSDFRVLSASWHKPDPKHEAINGRILCDDIVQFLGKVIVPGNDMPLTSLLIAR